MNERKKRIRISIEFNGSGSIRKFLLIVLRPTVKVDENSIEAILVDVGVLKHLELLDSSGTCRRAVSICSDVSEDIWGGGSWMAD